MRFNLIIWRIQIIVLTNIIFRRRGDEKII